MQPSSKGFLARSHTELSALCYSTSLHISENCTLYREWDHPKVKARSLVHHLASGGLSVSHGLVSEAGEEVLEGVLVHGDSAFLHEGGDGVLSWGFAGGEVQ